MERTTMKRLVLGGVAAVIALLLVVGTARLVATRSLAGAVSVPPILGINTGSAPTATVAASKSCIGQDGKTYQPGNLEWVKNADGSAQSGSMCNGSTGQMVQLNLSASTQAPAPGGNASTGSGGGTPSTLARKKGGDNGVRCAYYNQDTGEWEFYVPGETITIRQGGETHFLVCSSTGVWYFVGMVAPPSTGSKAPLPGGNAGVNGAASTGSLAPTPTGNTSTYGGGGTPITIGRKKTGDNGVRCAYFNQTTGEWEFYMPGEAIQVNSPHEMGWVWLVCGANGNWSIALTTAPSSGVQGPLPGGNIQPPAETPTQPSGPAAPKPAGIIP